MQIEANYLMKNSTTTLRLAAVLVIITAFGVIALPADNASAYSKSCQTVVLNGVGGGESGRVVTLRKSVSCRKAMSVARKAASVPFDFGDSLPAPTNWRCSGAQRPESGYSPKYLLGCFRDGRLSVAVRNPLID